MKNIKQYSIGFLVGAITLINFSVYAGSFDSITNMTQTWFDNVKIKLNGAYTSGKMCTSDATGQIQCITDIPNVSNIYSSGGNIGIGTSNPTSQLEIVSARPSLTLGDSDGKNYELISNGNTFAIDEKGLVNRFFINSTGNVGIGTASPSAKLEVNGDIVSKALVFKAYMSAAFAHPGGVWSKLPFNSIRFNTLPGTFDSRNQRFTPSRAGYYQISITGYSTTTSAQNDRYALGVKKNGLLERFGGSNYSLVDSPLSRTNMTIYCNGTTDYLEIAMFSAIAANLSGGNSGGHVMYWYMNYLGN